MNSVAYARSLLMITCVVALAGSAGAGAQSLAIADLGELDLEFANVQRVTLRPGTPRLMRIDTLPGDRLQLRLPFEANRIEPLIADGAAVSAGQPLARISGPELSLWLLEADSIDARFAAAQARFERSRRLFEQQSLSADSWQAISEHYRELQLAQHHTQHLRERLRVEDDHSALFLAPTGGLVLFTDNAAAGTEGEYRLAELLDANSLRLTVRLPSATRGEAITLATAGCELAVEHRAQRVSDFSRRLWSTPGACLPARPGQRLEGRVLHAFEGFRVPRSALMRHERAPVLARRMGTRLELVPVEVMGEDREHYYLVSDSALAGNAVLSRSTSAVQGLLLGLGAD